MSELIFITAGKIALFTTFFAVYLYLAFRERKPFLGVICIAWLAVAVEGGLWWASLTGWQSVVVTAVVSTIPLLAAVLLLWGVAEFIERPLSRNWLATAVGVILLQFVASWFVPQLWHNVLTVGALLFVYSSTFYMVQGDHALAKGRRYMFIIAAVFLYGISQMVITFYEGYISLRLFELLILVATAVRWELAYFERLHEYLQEKEQQWRASEEKFSKVFFGSPMATALSRVSDRRYIEVNDKFLELSGYSREEVIGQSAASLNIFYYEEEELAIGKALAEHGRASSMEITYQGKHGKLGSCLISVEIIFVAGERCFLSIIEDITERRQVEAALLRTQKLESLGVLAGGIAHDFNNLLVGVLGQTSLASKKLDHGSTAQPHIEKAITAAEKAAALTEQLLAYAGQGTIEFQPLNLNKLLQENIHLFQMALPHNAQLVVNLGDIPYVEGDRNQLQQVLMNLILNGAEALEGYNGTVTIETAVFEYSADLPCEIWLANGNQLQPGYYVTTKVIDTGIGMSPNTLGKIFDPFFSTKFTGRGLGLAAALGIVQSHHGGLQVTSVEQEGTTFTLYLPAYEPTG